ncbi:MAG: protein kinase, partial [Burkholderiales bacterium]|nr:protein kinase [Burkholderiales bacterium]
DGDLVPAFALQVAVRALGRDDGDMVLNLGRDVSLGARRWRTDEHLNLAGYIYPATAGGAVFPVDSFIDLYQGRVQADKYRDRIVLVGPTAARLAPRYDTPRGVVLPEVVVLAHVVSTLLQDDVPRTATWSKLFLAAILMATALYLALVLPRLRPLPALLITGAAVAALAGMQLLLMAVHLLWVPTGAALCLLLAGHPLTWLARRFAAPATSSAEAAPAADADVPVGNHRILGLAYHGQGQLDLAFEQFQQCPVDAQVMDNLYNLALDFERRRQYNKAQAVFEYMARHDPTFRDLQQRTARARQLSESGAVSSTAPGVQTRPADPLQASRLGRYEIERELGKGAMGVVYLGKDPKIGREVAIKTLALSTEFDEQELEQVRQRFFREAESAGRLTHPNIVTIFDAGEDHDLAYIAMEFLKGQDLSVYTKPQALLPLPAVISVMARVADALDYAHRQNVVHRDIKPGNIMYDPTSDTVKVTDFGIARITDSNRTKTGIVLGTPSFMSPEQLSGKKIDGQSDLFSLGVTLYQLCCGALPFKGDSMAQLMYRIANESPADPLSLNPALPDGLLEVLLRALAKRKEERFQSGAEMAEALRACQSAFTSVDLAL